MLVTMIAFKFKKGKMDKQERWLKKKQDVMKEYFLCLSGTSG